jgi:hypothetical protein
MQMTSGFQIKRICIDGMTVHAEYQKYNQMMQSNGEDKLLNHDSSEHNLCKI